MARLRRELGLFETSIYGIGVILGAGIYAIIGEGAGLAGNAVWLSFIIAAIVASFTGLSYAELSSMYPKTAAEYNYTRNAFRREWLAFLVGFIMIVAGLFFSATVSIGFAGYFSALFGTPLIFTAIGLIAALSLVNFIGIKQSSRINIISTLIEFSGLLIIIVIGLPYIGGAVNYFASPLGMSGIVGAAALLFFAFIGFENVANISEEARNATKIIPRALILSLIISTILYILVAISAVSVMGWETLSASGAPLADVAVVAAGPSMQLVLSVIALFATANTVLIMLIVTSRMIYGIAREYSRGFLSRIHKKRGTPHFAILTVLILSSLATLLGDLGTVANMTNAGVFITYVFVNLSLIRIRFTKPKEERPFKVPLNIGKLPILPVLGIASSLMMLVQFEPFILILELVLISLGYLFFRAFVRK
jgi:APA family basic amino acid/polyamine antiporter